MRFRGSAMAEGPVREKSYAFAVRLCRELKELQEQRKEFLLSKQCLRAGTSIGANVEEASAGQSRKDFLSKMSIASKEARETRYWLRLLRDTGYMCRDMVDTLIADCEELIRLLSAMVKTTRESTN